MAHFVYIVRCADGTLYTGYARDPHERERVHNSGRGARYTAGRRPVTLVFSERFRSVSGALRREYQIKQLNRGEKQALVAGTLQVRRQRRRGTTPAAAAPSESSSRGAAARGGGVADSDK